jgi:hypothetical protein
VVAVLSNVFDLIQKLAAFALAFRLDRFQSGPDGGKLSSKAARFRVFRRGLRIVRSTVPGTSAEYHSWIDPVQLSWVDLIRAIIPTSGGYLATLDITGEGGLALAGRFRGCSKGVLHGVADRFRGLFLKQYRLCRSIQSPIVRPGKLLPSEEVA